MRTAYFIFALALLALSTRAQDNKGATPQSSTSILINGQPIEGKVLEIDGKHFVAVEDLAQSLRGTISYGDGQIAIAFSQLPSTTAQAASSQPPSATTRPPSSQTSSQSAQPHSPQLSTLPAPPPASQRPPVTQQTLETGRVQGTLTYFVDFHIGNKPDFGSKVWLVEGRAEIPADKHFVGTSSVLGTSENPDQYKATKYSITDENGHFELLDVPPGEYTLIMQSAHTKGTLNEKRGFFGIGNGHNPRDMIGRVEFLHLSIKVGETVDASKDFGPNVDM